MRILADRRGPGPGLDAPAVAAGPATRSRGKGPAAPTGPGHPHRTRPDGDRRPGARRLRVPSPWRPTAAPRPGARLALCRLQLATLQDRLTGSALGPEARAELEARATALAARISQLAALRGRLVQVLLG